MKISHKKFGLGMVAAAVALAGSAAIADNMGKGGPGFMLGGFDFAAADANKDGKVTKEEFDAWRAARVAGIDTDKDGKISVEELAAMNLKQMQAMADARAQRMVKELDTDGDGKLSAAELVAHPMPMDVFALADTNKDGVVDQAEAEAAQRMMWRSEMGGHHGKHQRGGMMDDDDQGFGPQNGQGNGPGNGLGKGQQNGQGGN